MDSLAFRYRPRVFADLIGQRAVQVILQRMLVKNSVFPALLFEGPSGVGKTTAARILSAALVCQVSEDPCGHCLACDGVFAGTSLDVVEIDASSFGLDERVEALERQLAGACRVVIIEEAHLLSAAMFSFILRVLEEPPPHTVFILITTESGGIPEPVLSRCVSFLFRRVSVTDTVNQLKRICDAEGIQAQLGLLSLIAERANGSLRAAVMVLDQVSHAGVSTEKQFQELWGEYDYAPKLLTEILSGDIVATYVLFDEALTHLGDVSHVVNSLVSVLKDILILQSGGDLSKQGVALEERLALVLSVTTGQLISALRLIWEFKTKIHVGEDSYIMLSLLVSMLSEVFGSISKAGSAPVAPRKMTLAEMRDFNSV